VFDNGLVGSILIQDNYDMGLCCFGEKRTQVIMMGGKAANLEYTNFGFWEERVTMQDWETPGTIITVGTYKPFTLAATSAVKKAPSGGIFSGTVLARAYDRPAYSQTRVESLVGKANLDATTKQLTFSFPNFYTMKTGLTIDTTGNILQTGGFTLSDPQKNTTGINLLNGDVSSVTGQFYAGSSATPATEAVGIFSYGPADHGVSGTFGMKEVKKSP